MASQNDASILAALAQVERNGVARIGAPGHGRDAGSVVLDPADPRQRAIRVVK